MGKSGRKSSFRKEISFETFSDNTLFSFSCIYIFGFYSTEMSQYRRSLQDVTSHFCILSYNFCCCSFVVDGVLFLCDFLCRQLLSSWTVVVVSIQKWGTQCETGQLVCLFFYGQGLAIDFLKQSK